MKMGNSDPITATKVYILLKEFYSFFLSEYITLYFSLANWLNMQFLTEAKKYLRLYYNHFQDFTKTIISIKNFRKTAYFNQFVHKMVRILHRYPP